ncbi:MAG: metallophosphoesterase [bacterium]|nr:metallophosphoesterase [bacterium]
MNTKAVVGGGTVCILAILALVMGMLVEPRRIVVREVDLGGPRARYRVAHFSDLHYKGDRAFLRRAIDTVNALDPDFACFTGDIVEDAALLDEALAELRRVRAPLYGVPGNHEYRSGASPEAIAAAFEATGGAWLVDATASPDGAAVLIGLAQYPKEFIAAATGGPRILLTHYPETADSVGGARFDLILAGHSHGGQIRIPFLGALLTPPGSGRYERGLYRTPAGPLHVNPGIGTFAVPLRLFCPPEVTLIRL